MEGTLSVMIVPFDNVEFALAICAKYRELFPDDTFSPEVEKCTDCSGHTVQVKVPCDKYESFDWASESVMER